MKYNIFFTFTLNLGSFFTNPDHIRIFGRSRLKKKSDPDPGKKPGSETLVERIINCNFYIKLPVLCRVSDPDPIGPFDITENYIKLFKCLLKFPLRSTTTVPVSFKERKKYNFVPVCKS